MSRPKKKNTNPALSMEQLLSQAIELFQEPYDDRDERDASLPSLRTVATALNTTIPRTRKLLITAEYFSTSTSRTVQALVAEGRRVEEIMAETGIGKASINSYLPYKNLAFNLDQTTVNADRHRVFRRRVKAVSDLHSHMDSPDVEVWLWKAIIAFEGYPFRTSGRGSREGTCSMSKKKITDPTASMEELLQRAVQLAEAPFTPNRKPELPSLRTVAAALNTTVIRIWNLLITAGYFTSPTASTVQRLKAEGKTIEEIGIALRLKPAAVYGYLPFNLRAYNLPETTSNADRHMVNEQHRKYNVM